MALEISRNARVLSNASEEDTTLAVTAAPGDTTLTVTSIASLPIWASGKQYRLLLTLGASDPSQDELVLVTDGATVALVVTRGIEGTVAVDHGAGTLVYMVQSEGWRANNPGILSVAGDLAYVTTGGDMARLAIGLQNDVLTVSAGSLPSWAAPATHGDVVGPSSSVDDTIARYDGTTGKLLNNYTSGGPTISDTGAVTIGTLTAGRIVYTGTGGLISADAGMAWDSANTKVTFTTTGTAGFEVVTDNNTANPRFTKYLEATGAMSQLMQKARGTLSAPRRALSGDVLGGMTMVGAEAADNSTNATFPASQNAAAFRAFALADQTSTDHGAYMRFDTCAAGSTTLTERMRVSDAGVKAVGYVSSDGTAGATAGPFTVITAITVKNGLVTNLTGS